MILFCPPSSSPLHILATKIRIQQEVVPWLIAQFAFYCSDYPTEELVNTMCQMLTAIIKRDTIKGLASNYERMAAAAHRLNTLDNFLFK